LSACAPKASVASARALRESGRESDFVFVCANHFIQFPQYPRRERSFFPAAAAAAAPFPPFFHQPPFVCFPVLCCCVCYQLLRHQLFHLGEERERERERERKSGKLNCPLVQLLRNERLFSSNSMLVFCGTCKLLLKVLFC
jgi:hypothetical protein